METAATTMEISLWIERENLQKKINFFGTNVKQLLELLKINPETVLVVRNNEVITETEKLNHRDHVDLISVISGG